jgi:hypothetical protein
MLKNNLDVIFMVGFFTFVYLALTSPAVIVAVPIFTEDYTVDL